MPSTAASVVNLCMCERKTIGYCVGKRMKLIFSYKDRSVEINSCGIGLYIFSSKKNCFVSSLLLPGF